MPVNPNRLSKFWQELKRRRVVHVSIVYATAAFVIIELVNNVSEPLHLPDWTPTLMILILAVGFPIAVIFSWIFDVTPEGIEKTSPSEEAGEKGKTPAPNSWRIATYVSIAVVIGLVILNLMGRRGHAGMDESMEKSIAVMPFKNFSADPDQEHMCLGLTDEIINHLFKIKSFDKVASLSSVLTYRETDKRIPEVAEELKVSYVLEGTYKKIGEQLRVTAQLIEAKSDRHLWQSEYDRPYEEIITIQADIALQIADQVKAYLTSDEKKNIQKIPTHNQEAYELLQEAMYVGIDDSTTFAGWYGKELDLALRAIELDPEYADAFAVAGYCILGSGNYAGGSEMRSAGWDALHYFEKALEIDPDNASALFGLAQLNDWFIWDYVRAEKGFQKAMKILPNHPMYPGQYGEFLTKMNRVNEAKRCFFGLEPTFHNQYREIRREIISGNHNEALHSIQNLLGRWEEEAYLWAGEAFTWLEEYDSALFCLEAGKQAGDQEINIPRFQACLALVYNKITHDGQARAIISQLIARSDTTSAMSPDFFTGWYYSGIGEADSAFFWLEKAYHNRSPEIPWLKVDPVITNLKEDARYRDLYERAGHRAYDAYLAGE